MSETTIRLLAAFMAGISACQAARWSVIAVREFLRERRAAARHGLDSPP